MSLSEYMVHMGCKTLLSNNLQTAKNTGRIRTAWLGVNAPDSKNMLTMHALYISSSKNGTYYYKQQ